MQQSAGRARRVCACAWWRSGRPEARQCGAAVLCMVAVSGGGCERSCDGWSAISGRQCDSIAGRRCGDGGEHGGHASGKRLASCRQAWCRRAAVERASVQRVGSDGPRVVWVQQDDGEGL